MSKLDRRDFMKKTAIAGTATAVFIAGENTAFACSYNRTANATQLSPRLKKPADWDLADFEPLVGTPFEIDGRMMVLEAIRKGPETPVEFREQFALVFEAGKVNGMESEIMPVWHPRLGKFDVFVNITGYSDSEPGAEIYFS